MIYGFTILIFLSTLSVIYVVSIEAKVSRIEKSMRLLGYTNEHTVSAVAGWRFARSTLDQVINGQATNEDIRAWADDADHEIDKLLEKEIG